jgi:chloramphenicol-sensitive protein RarD
MKIVTVAQRQPMSARPTPKHREWLGTWYAAFAFGLWGVLPVYWKLLKTVSPYEIVAHRVVWACAFTALVLLLRRRPGSYREIFRSGTRLRGIACSAFLLGLNWLVFIHAVNSDQVLQASLGYYINPLVSVFLGLVILKERTNLGQKAAIGLAFAGVMILSLHHGGVPWIALSLALTFGIYGLVKKTGRVDPVIGLNIETLLMVPVAFGYILWTGFNGSGALASPTPSMVLLLISTGAVTAVPLLFFALGAQRIPLSRVGFIQYLTPTLFFILGRFVYREPFPPVQLISFIFIWTALVVYTLSHRRPHAGTHGDPN